MQAIIAGQVFYPGEELPELIFTGNSQALRALENPFPKVVVLDKPVMADTKGMKGEEKSEVEKDFRLSISEHELSVKAFEGKKKFLFEIEKSKDKGTKFHDKLKVFSERRGEMAPQIAEARKRAEEFKANVETKREGE